MNSRIKYIDISKGLGIILVVLGHSYSSENLLTTWIGSFHMSFFFIISGFLYGLRYSLNKEVKFKFKEKIGTLLIPYLIWGSLYQLFVLLLEIIGGAPVLETAKMRLMLIVTLQSGVMWFLPAMFIALLLFITTCHNRYLSYFTCIACLTASIYVPYSSDFAEAFLRPLSAVFFLGFGFHFCRLFAKKVSLTVSILIIVLTFILAPYGGIIDMASRSYGSLPIMAVIKAIFGSYAFLHLSQTIETWLAEDNILERLGNKSIIVLCIHPFIIQIVRLADHFIFGNILKNLGIAEGILITSATVAVIVLMIPSVLKRFSWMWGMRESL